MNKKLVLAAVIISTALTSYLISVRVDPEGLILKSQEKFSTYSDFKLVYDMNIRVSMFGAAIDYLTTYSLSKSGSKVVYDSQYSTPFSIGVMRSSMYVLDEGNYSCSSEYGVSACYPISDEDLLISFGLLDEFVVNDFVDIEFLGTKLVNGENCNILNFILNKSYLNNTSLGFSPELDYSVLTEITDFGMVVCINEETGFTLESSTFIKGKISSPESMIALDLSYNMTQIIVDYSFEVPSSDFILPYPVMSFEDYEQLINETLEYA